MWQPTIYRWNSRVYALFLGPARALSIRSVSRLAQRGPAESRGVRLHIIPPVTGGEGVGCLVGLYTGGDLCAGLYFKC